ncbi:MAG: trypsin-like peptidase domain-containing protein [Defluviitaleaceae bacterium]|nr:trypsin-like peptidase domain-containing protein [Defluviitaleaceae bacterium]
MNDERNCAEHMEDMYDLPSVPPDASRAKKKNPNLRTAATIVCAMILMLGSGYAGARLALSQIHAPDFSMTPLAYESPQHATDSQHAANSQHMSDSQHAANSEAAHSFDSLRTSASAMSLPELFDGANPAVVAISTEITGRNAFGMTVTRPSAGSGFLISNDGFIVTNEHVIENARSIMVLMYDGRELPATVIGSDIDSDIAIIKIDGTNFPFLTFGDSDAVRVGEQVAAIGNPLGELANSMTVGYISALNRDIYIEGTSRNKIQTDAAINRGNSGGPLLNLHGEVVGVISAKSTGLDVEGLGFAIPANQAQDVANQLIRYGFVRGRAILGVSINIQPGAHQVQIATVNAGSAAERAGMLVGDVILSANGEPVLTFAQLRAILDTLTPGESAEFRVRRNGEELTLTVILDEYRPAGL